MVATWGGAICCAISNSVLTLNGGSLERHHFLECVFLTPISYSLSQCFSILALSTPLCLFFAFLCSYNLQNGMYSIGKLRREIYVTIHQGEKFCLLETLLFYFSNSVDFKENKLPFIHCNSDIEALPKMLSYTLAALLFGSVAWKSHINKVQISCPVKLMTWLIYMSPSN